MKTVGLCRVRNEELVIGETVDCLGAIVDEIYMFDDASTDNTGMICRHHPKVKGVVEGKERGSRLARLQLRVNSDRSSWSLREQIEG